MYCVGDVEVRNAGFLFLGDLSQIGGYVIVPVFAYGYLLYLYYRSQSTEQSPFELLQLTAHSLCV